MPSGLYHTLANQTQASANRSAGNTLETQKGTVENVYTDANGNVTSADVLIYGQKKVLVSVPNATGVKLTTGAVVTVNNTKGNPHSAQITGYGSTGSSTNGSNVTSTSTNAAANSSPANLPPPNNAGSPFVLWEADTVGGTTNGLIATPGSNITFQETPPNATSSGGGNYGTLVINANRAAVTSLPAVQSVLDGTLVDLVDSYGNGLGMYRASHTLNKWVREDIGGNYTATAPIVISGTNISANNATSSAPGVVQLTSGSSDVNPNHAVAANDPRLLNPRNAPVMLESSDPTDFPNGYVELPGANMRQIITPPGYASGGATNGSVTWTMNRLVVTSLPAIGTVLDGTLADLVDSYGNGLGMYRASSILGKWVREDIGTGGSSGGGVSLTSSTLFSAKGITAPQITNTTVTSSFLTSMTTYGAGLAANAGVAGSFLRYRMSFGISTSPSNTLTIAVKCGSGYVSTTAFTPPASIAGGYAMLDVIMNLIDTIRSYGTFTISIPSTGVTYTYPVYVGVPPDLTVYNAFNATAAWGSATTNDSIACTGMIVEFLNPNGSSSGGGGSSGVSSLNSLTGALNLVAGSNITLTPSGTNITINSSASSGATPTGLNGSSACPTQSFTNSMANFQPTGGAATSWTLAAGYYEIRYNIPFTAGSTANDTYIAQLYNSTASAVINGSTCTRSNVQASTTDVLEYSCCFYLSTLSTINLQVQNSTAARGTVTCSGLSTTLYSTYSQNIYTLPVITSFTPNYGLSGTSVSIYGSGFSNVTGSSGVSFYGTNATSYTVNSDTQITATVPSLAASSSGAITVAVPNVFAGSLAAVALGTYFYSNTATLPVSSGLVAWWDAAQITGVTNGSALGSWSDSSGNGWTLTQGTTAQKPTYNTNQLAGNPAVTFTKSSSQIMTTSSVPSTSSAHTLFVVYKTPPTIANFGPLVYNGNSGSNGYGVLGEGATSTHDLFGGVVDKTSYTIGVHLGYTHSDSLRVWIKCGVLKRSFTNNMD